MHRSPQSPPVARRAQSIRAEIREGLAYAWAIKEIRATIVLVDNDGGGIFSFLPQARTDDPGAGLPEHYEELFGTPHGIDFGPIVEALGATYRPVGARGLRTALAESLVATGISVLQLRTERARNLELHAEAASAVAAALTGLGA